MVQFDPNAAAVAVDTSSDGSVVVRGTPVSRGVYRGPARVVTRLADAESIQKVLYSSAYKGCGVRCIFSSCTSTRDFINDR